MESEVKVKKVNPFLVRLFPLKWAFFNGDRNRVLSDPRYRPPTPVLMDESEK